MMETLIVACGLAHFCILIASAQVPYRLRWREELSPLSKLHRQMYWTYGGYVVLAITAFAIISTLNAKEIASGSGLARGFCAYVSVFWGIRVVLQAVFDAKEHLTTWWLTMGYHTLTVLFLAFTVSYGIAAVNPGLLR